MPFNLPPWYMYVFVGLFAATLVVLLVLARWRLQEFARRTATGQFAAQLEAEEQSYQSRREVQLNRWMELLEAARKREKEREAAQEGERRKWLEDLLNDTRMQIFPILQGEVGRYLSGLQSVVKDVGTALTGQEQGWVDMTEEWRQLREQLGTGALLVRRQEAEDSVLGAPRPPEWPEWAQKEFYRFTRFIKTADRDALLATEGIGDEEAQLLATNLWQAVENNVLGRRKDCFDYREILVALQRSSGDHAVRLERSMAQTALFLWAKPNGAAEKSVLTFDELYRGSKNVIILEEPLPSEGELVMSLRGRRR